MACARSGTGAAGRSRAPTGRIGLWFAFAGFFLIYASIQVRGRAALDDLEEFRWYLMVPLVLAALQLLGGWFLGRRSPADDA